MNASTHLSNPSPQVKLSWRIRDLTGQKFGRWTVIRFIEVRDGYSIFWCRCECGKEDERKGKNLSQGISKSCGCLQREAAAKSRKKHGEAAKGIHSPEYDCWNDVKKRCNGTHHRYGGRGIKYCERWNLYENFISDMGRKPFPNYTIERIDRDGDYEPSNCIWATRKTQANNKSDNHLIEFRGEKMNISQWAEKLGMNKNTLSNRLVTRKWTVERALTEVVKPRGTWSR